MDGNTGLGLVWGFGLCWVFEVQGLGLLTADINRFGVEYVGKLLTGSGLTGGKEEIGPGPGGFGLGADGARIKPQGLSDLIGGLWA